MMFRLLLLFSLGYHVASHAQFNVGVRAGAQLSTIATYRSLERPTMRFVPSGGLLVKYDWKGGLGVQSEINFAAKGYKSSKETIKSNYLDLPLLIRLEIPVPLGENYKVYGLAGPYAGFRLSQTFSYKDTLNEKDVKEAYKGSRMAEYGWQLGAGFMYPFKIGHFFGELRYSFALSNITKGYSLDRNRTVGIFVGYVLPLSALKIVKETTTPDKLMVIPDAE